MFRTWGVIIRQFIYISCWRILVQELYYSKQLLVLFLTITSSLSNHNNRKETDEKNILHVLQNNGKL